MNLLTAREAATVRYIKLGEGGSWAATAIQRNELPFGYAAVPHEIASRSKEEIVAYLSNVHSFARNASNHARQIFDFYNMDEACLWITFANDRLWWTRAYKEVIWLGGQIPNYASRIRRCIDGWSDRDFQGKELIASRLSTRLTMVAGFRMTVCEVKAKEYLLRRIAGIEEPLIARWGALRLEMAAIVAEAITLLHWVDFETLIDLVFARSGWNRASALGKNNRDWDLQLENPVTGERACVQVKSAANSAILGDYLERYDRSGTCQRMFFICHSPQCNLPVPDGDDVQVWQPKDLATGVVRLGLQDWIFERIA